MSCPCSTPLVISFRMLCEQRYQPLEVAFRAGLAHRPKPRIEEVDESSMSPILFPPVFSGHVPAPLTSTGPHRKGLC